MDSLSACLFKEANFHCFLSYPLQWPSPALWARFVKGLTLVKKIPGLSPFISKAVHVSLLLHEKDCPLQFDSKPRHGLIRV